MYNKLLLTIVFSIYSFAIVSIKPVEVDKQKDTVLALGLGYKQLSGNTQKQEINLDTMIQKHFDSLVLYFNTTYDYAHANDIRNQNKTFTHLRGIYKLNTYNAVELFSQLQSNEFRSIQSRLLFGAGDRLRIKTKNSKFFLGLGAMFVNLKEKDTDSVDLIRANSYVSYSGNFKNIKINYILYYQPDITKFSDFQFNNSLQFIFTIDKQLSFNIDINNTYDSQPAQDKKRYNFAQKYGLTYKFNTNKQ